MLWRNSKSRALTKERTPERDLTGWQVGAMQVLGESTAGRGTDSAKALGWECACVFGKQQGR